MLPATRRDVRRYLVRLDQHDLGFWDVGAGVAEAETRREKGRRCSPDVTPLASLEVRVP